MNSIVMVQVGRAVKNNELTLVSNKIVSVIMKDLDPARL